MSDKTADYWLEKYNHSRDRNLELAREAKHWKNSAEYWRKRAENLIAKKVIKNEKPKPKRKR